MSAEEAVAPRLMVEVWEDLVCPWCYLGRRRLEAAVQAFERPPAVTVLSRAFELAPRMPRGAGHSVADWLTGWGMSTEQVDAKLSGAARAAEADGLQFDWPAGSAWPPRPPRPFRLRPFRWVRRIWRGPDNLPTGPSGRDGSWPAETRSATVVA